MSARNRKENIKTETVETTVEELSIESIGAQYSPDELNLTKTPFVSPRRIVEATTIKPGVRTSPSRTKPNRSSPRRKVQRPCHKEQSFDDHKAEEDDVLLDSVIKAPSALVLTPNSLQKRNNLQARSLSSDSAPSSPSFQHKSFDHSGRVRSLSPDGRACSSPARGTLKHLFGERDRNKKNILEAFRR